MISCTQLAISFLRTLATSKSLIRSLLSLSLYCCIKTDEVQRVPAIGQLVVMLAALCRLRGRTVRVPAGLITV